MLVCACLVALLANCSRESGAEVEAAAQRSPSNGTTASRENRGISGSSVFGLTDAERQALEARAESGDGRAASRLAESYAFSDDTESNRREAVRWWTAAAKLGSAQAAMNLAYYYDRWPGDDAASQERIHWLIFAGEMGEAKAFIQLSEHYQLHPPAPGQCNLVTKLRWMASANLQRADSRRVARDDVTDRFDAIPRDYCKNSAG